MTTPMRPMLATAGSLPRDEERWSYEMKWDGIRVIADAGPAGVRLTGRSGADMTPTYPELAELAELLPGRSAVLDGEVVVLRADGSADFGALAPRMHVRSADRARQLAASVPVTYVAFDLLELDGSSTLRLPYAERRRRLEGLDLRGEHCLVAPAFPGHGAEVLEVSRRLGLEGIIAKRLDSPYRPGRRSGEWVKIKNMRTQEVVIGGFTAGEGQRATSFGALLLGLPAEGGLTYVGSVGTGFDERTLADLTARLRSLEARESPFAGPVDPRQARTARWVRPELVGEVQFGHWTSDGRMRHPSWRGLRPDKVPREVVREE